MNKSLGGRVRRTTNPIQITSDVYTRQSESMESPGFCHLPYSNTSIEDDKQVLINEFRMLRDQINTVMDKLRTIGVDVNNL